MVVVAVGFHDPFAAVWVVPFPRGLLLIILWYHVFTISMHLNEKFKSQRLRVHFAITVRRFLLCRTLELELRAGTDSKVSFPPVSFDFALTLLQRNLK